MIPTMGEVVAGLCQMDPEFMPALRMVVMGLTDQHLRLEIFREIHAHVLDRTLPDDAARVETIASVLVVLNSRNLGCPLVMNDEIMAAWRRQGIGTEDCLQCIRCDYVTPASYENCPVCGGAMGELNIPSVERWIPGRWKN